MAGNKFRTFRKSEKEERKNDIEKDCNIILKKNYQILTKPKEDEKYRSEEIFKEGTVKKVIDIIHNEDNIYIKILNKINNIRYIALHDKEGNNIVEKHKYLEKKEEKKSNSKIETFGSIRLCDSKTENEQKNIENNSFKKANELMTKMIRFMGPKELNPINIPQESTNTLNNQNNNAEDESDPFSKNDAFSQVKNEKSPNKKEIKGDNIKENISQKEEKKNIYSKQNMVNYSEQLCPINKNFCQSFNSDSLSKTYLVNFYLLKRELKRIEKEEFQEDYENKGMNFSFEQKYEKGIQVIYRPLEIEFKNFNLKKFDWLNRKL